ncbi:phosphocholine cytidylyltransferase family protein [Gammaproteobacteria bacterium]|nr:phosphocholine cytidylyltransferase family protein [Gammaproteobacteria bacterium]
MKAIILAAGVGSRIRPLTDNCPKSLLKINGKTILEMMLSHIKTCGINEVIFVLGYLQDQIKDYVKTQFPDLIVQFITNEKYEVTNTGYSLMLTKDFVKNSTFIKFDADVVFDINILKTLIASEYDNCLCIDKNINLDAEEIKVIIKDDNRVVKASKTVNPLDAIGESIGIEKISGETAHTLFNDLELMMKDEEYHQEYYEAAYERLIEKDVPFYALDISGLRWTEIDTKEDFMLAGKIFSQSK